MPEAAKGEKTCLVAQGQAPGRHSFLLTKRSEGEEGATTFRGLELASIRASSSTRRMRRC